MASGEAQDGLMDFYVAYRHLVRGLVRGLQSTELDADAEYQAKAKKKSQAHFLMALGKLEQPGQRPCLILLGGLPGPAKAPWRNVCTLGKPPNFFFGYDPQEIGRTIP